MLKFTGILWLRLAMTTAALLPTAAITSEIPSDSLATAAGDLMITPVNHASLVLRHGGIVVYVDPVGAAQRYAGIVKAGLILITDIHGDHLDAATIQAVRDGKTVIVAPAAARQKLVDSGIPATTLRILANGETLQHAGVGIEALPMYNLTPERRKFHEKGRGNGYVLDFSGTRVYVSGDSEDITEMRKLARIDVAFICMNLPYTMSAEQAASAVLEMQPRIVYPYHYRGAGKNGTQDPRQFKARVEAKSRSVEVRLRNWYAVP